jgi:hypothetical protein
MLRDAYRKYTGRPNDFTYEQRLALMHRDNWASAQSGISGEFEQEYSIGVEEINAQTLDTRCRPENDAQKEKKRYDLRKVANIKIYNRQSNTVRSAIRSAEKDLRGEKKKVEDARAKVG